MSDITPGFYSADFYEVEKRCNRLNPRELAVGSTTYLLGLLRVPRAHEEALALPTRITDKLPVDKLGHITLIKFDMLGPEDEKIGNSFGVFEEGLWLPEPGFNNLKEGFFRLKPDAVDDELNELVAQASTQTASVTIEDSPVPVLAK